MQGVSLVFLKEPQINTDVFKKALDSQIDLVISTGNTATDSLLKSIIDALNEYTIALAKEQIRIVFEQAEKEVTDLHQRTKEGLETARLNGKQIGQKKGAKLITKKSLTAKEKLIKHCKDFGGSLSDSECMELLGISRNTFYKYKREIKEQF